MKSYEEILLSKRSIKTVYVIYALIQDDEIVYIGQSKNILSRLGEHLRSSKVFDSWCIVENLGVWTTPREVDNLEQKYIRKYLPKLNKVHNKKYYEKRKLKTKQLKEQKEKARRKRIWKYSQTGIVKRG